jgi:hypothetical protein
MAHQPVGDSLTLTTGTTSTRLQFTVQSDTLRVVPVGQNVHVAIGTTATAATTDYFVPNNTAATLNLGRVSSIGIAGITKAAATIIDLPEGTGCPFEVDDVIITSGITGETGFNTTAKVVSIDSSANTYGYHSERITTDHDSRALSGTPVVTDGEARRLLTVAARTDSGTGKLYAQQVQVSGDSEMKVIVEERNGKKNLFIEGIFLQGEIKNRNGRMYPMNTLSREVGRYNENFVCKGRALGELGHPDGPTVNLDRVSHKITSLRQEGNNFIGKAQILSTPMGNIAKSLLGEGVKLGVSSRGVGSLNKTNEGYSVVGEDFTLATAADIVSDPSAPDAFVDGIMEGKDWVWDGDVLRERYAQKTYKRINTLVDQKRLDENKLSLFNDFLGSL